MQFSNPVKFKPIAAIKMKLCPIDFVGVSLNLASLAEIRLIAKFGDTRG
jgi:hypothetical protein